MLVEGTGDVTKEEGGDKAFGDGSLLDQAVGAQPIRRVPQDTPANTHPAPPNGGRLDTFVENVRGRLERFEGGVAPAAPQAVTTGLWCW